MEGDELETSSEELQTWIREKVKTLTAPDVQEKCDLLHSLLERREKRAAHLLRLCQSVSTCEAVVKKQYSLLGWEYRAIDSDDDNKTDCGSTVPSSPTTNGLTSLLPKRHDSENLHGVMDKKTFISRKGEPVVVLTRLSAKNIRSFCPWMLANPDGEEESLTNSDSDMQWEPEGDSSDSDFTVSNNMTVPNKRRKMDQKNKKLTQSHATPQASTNAGAKSNRIKTPTPTPQASTNGNAKSNVTKTSILPATTNAPKNPPKVPQVDLKANMSILARRKAMCWQPGKILEKVTKEDGKLKYKIKFDEKGKSLVSGHHIAFDCMPTVDQLFVGARVVVKFPADQCQFFPGVLGELPTRKNRMRFLVFIDDHKAAYVGLPLLRLVCRPLKDPLDDIPDGFHKDFIRGYMKAWPYPPQTLYRVGQTINAELNGVLQSCVVQLIDSSLIQIAVSTDQRKEWIYRGSTCLEQMMNTRGAMALKKDEGQKNKSPS